MRSSNRGLALRDRALLYRDLEGPVKDDGLHGARLGHADRAPRRIGQTTDGLYVPVVLVYGFGMLKTMSR